MSDQNIEAFERLLLMLLDARSERFAARQTLRSGRYVRETLDQGSLLQIGIMRPELVYTFDGSDPDRIYTGDFSQLLRHPSEILGDRSEAAVLHDRTGTMKWIGLRRLTRNPGVAVYGRAVTWYAMHFRTVVPRGVDEYQRRVVPLNAHGAPLLAKCQGHIVCSEKDAQTFVLACSLIEDAQRVNSLLCTVRDTSLDAVAGGAAAIRFPVPYADYQDLFKLRDGPLTPAGKRRAILHWVIEHLRRKPSGGECEVKAHWRGIRDLCVGDLRISIIPNDIAPEYI
jgi:hypothetical protein